ncbi:MAG: hypothetical protein EHM70_00885 [Chloroflexota bacterium]|nr:MAG: hypothetical protein EHM70_00885 [Chloroflexota bacterium]
MKLHTRFICSALILLILLLSVTLTRADAAAGLPDSPEFAYGARLDMHGEQVQSSINVAAGLGLDWIAIDFDWGREWPDASILPDLTPLNQAMANAKQVNLAVMVSITTPPAWACTAAGPDPNLAASLVISLARLYPGTLLAVELFPGSNTIAGWCTIPDPAAYMNLLNTIQASLQTANTPLAIVAGGLVPLPASDAGSGIHDLVFLDGLYQAGAAQSMPILSMRLTDVTGDPMTAPNGSEHRLLRHFEELRKVMLQYNHQNGLIWLTGFGWPSGSIQASDSAYATPDAQSQWLNQAYRLLRPQLYIGAGFYQKLNPGVALASQASLVLPDGTLHPACTRLGQLISLEGNTQTVIFQGSISKKTPMKLTIKP